MDPEDLPTLDRTRVRELDRIAIEDFGLPGVVLMENAGAGAARAGLRFVLVGPPEGLLAPGVQALRAVSAAARRPAAHPA